MKYKDKSSIVDNSELKVNKQIFFARFTIEK